ncbi:hypothetical protein [Nonomuraea sediminis]|uniref:hypothetical protein n=1 Tax=Nonomuraea sediminis TaxID=2835864 RepID=UPI001BDD60C1|nr:hypothetical protein [Nonomuraea sediminis]
MGKFDGMDPKLVRELLAEVKRVAGELRTTESRVAHVMSVAGLPTQTTHRPSQVADAADTMVHDVSARLALLEKKHDPTPTTIVGGDQHTTTGDHTPAQDHKPVSDPPSDHKPASDQPSGHTTESGHQTVSGDLAAESGKHDQAKDPVTQPTQLDPHKPHVVEVDGVKVLQVPIDPPTATELNDLIKNIDQVQPHDLPAATVHHPGQVEPGDARPWVNDGSDVVSVNVKPISPEALKNLIDHIRDVQPMDMPHVEVPKGEWGHGDWAPKHIQPDGPTGTVDPGGPTHHTAPPGSSDHATTAGGGVHAVQGVDDGGGRDAQSAYADDGSDVVSVNAKPLDLDALRTLHDHVREVQPLDMPGVEVPKGEWGHGEWTPKDIEPDGPTGTIEPGAPERSA